MYIMQFYNGRTFDSHFLKCAPLELVKCATSRKYGGPHLWRCPRRTHDKREPEPEPEPEPEQ